MNKECNKEKFSETSVFSLNTSVTSLKKLDLARHKVSINLEKFESKDKTHLLPYQGEKGSHLTKSLKRNLKSLLPSTVKANIGLN